MDESGYINNDTYINTHIHSDGVYNSIYLYIIKIDIYRQIFVCIDRHIE